MFIQPHIISLPMCKKKKKKNIWQLTSGWKRAIPIHQWNNSMFASYLPYTCSSLTSVLSALSVQKSHPVAILQDWEDCLPLYFVSFLSQTSKSFHLDGRYAWWFMPVARTCIQHLNAPRAGLCSNVDKPVNRSTELEHLEPFRSSCVDNVIF